MLQANWARDQLLLFSSRNPPKNNKIKKRSSKLFSGNETELLVDDEVTIIDVCEDMLSILGYNILTAHNGRNVFKIYEGNKWKIDLVILDMIMHGFSGSETFDQFKLID